MFNDRYSIGLLYWYVPCGGENLASVAMIWLMSGVYTGGQNFGLGLEFWPCLTSLLFRCKCEVLMCELLIAGRWCWRHCEVC